MIADLAWSPLEITPATGDVSADPAGLAELIGRIDLDTLLVSRKALLLRGFGIDPAALDAAIELLLPNRLAYLRGNTPRSKVGGNIYTSTEYPPDQSISMHSELSYAHRWPSRLLFYCETPAQRGGATALADAAVWLTSIDAEVRAAFANGLRYVQNLHDGVGLGKSWQQSFETEERAVVERFLADSGAEWDWLADGLRVSQTRPATLRHPVTTDEVWFNQVDQWHSAGLPDAVRTALLRIVPEDELPQTVTFADGTPIPADYVRHVREIGWRHAFDVAWAAGDLLLVDNQAVAHARRPYAGERRILVAMSGAA